MPDDVILLVDTSLISDRWFGHVGSGLCVTVPWSLSSQTVLVSMTGAVGVRQPPFIERVWQAINFKRFPCGLDGAGVVRVYGVLFDCSTFCCGSDFQASFYSVLGF